MQRGRISLVLVPTVFRKTVVQLFHQFIPEGLGQNRGRSYTLVQTISLDNRDLRNGIQRYFLVAVHQNQPGLWVQTHHAKSHGLEACPQDVDAVNVLWGLLADLPGKRLVHDLCPKAQPL